ncbi:MAG: hypothetical protein AAFX93_17285 [Verrucomicrobiota bacterium]
MKRLLILSLLISSPILAQDQDGDHAAKIGVNLGADFVFEGDIDYVDPALRSKIGPPQVLSGTIAIKPRYLDEGESISTFVHRDSITAAEITLDRNYVVNYEAFLSDRDSFVEVVNGEDNEKDDRITFSLQMAGGEVGDSEYIISDLVIELSDDAGEMLSSADLAESAPPFESGAFQISFFNLNTGEQAKATGTVTVFANLEREITPEQDYKKLEEQILELDNLLSQKEQTIGALQAELANARATIRDRNTTITNLELQNNQLIEEKEALETGEAIETLQQTNAELLSELEESHSAREFSAGTISQMTLRQEFLAKDNSELSTSNAKLRNELANSLAELGAMRNELETMKRQAQEQYLRSIPVEQKRLPLATPAVTPISPRTEIVQTPPTPAPEPEPILRTLPAEPPATASISPPQTPPLPDNSIVVVPQAPQAPQPEPEESSNRVPRRGPRR